MKITYNEKKPVELTLGHTTDGDIVRYNTKDESIVGIVIKHMISFNVHIVELSTGRTQIVPHSTRIDKIYKLEEIVLQEK